MARLALTPQNAPGSFPALPLAANAADFVFTPAGAQFVDGFSFPWTGRELLLVQNANAGAQTVTLNSVADRRRHRSGDITTYSVGIGEFAVFGPFEEADGWRQSDGKIYGAASATDVKLAVIKF